MQMGRMNLYLTMLDKVPFGFKLGLNKVLFFLTMALREMKASNVTCGRVYITPIHHTYAEISGHQESDGVQKDIL